MSGRKHDLIFKALQEGILGGKYAAGKALPSERALMKRFGVSRNTVQHAFRELETRGFVFRRQGKGTMVSARSAWRTNRIGLIVHGSSYCEIFPPTCKELSHLVQQRPGGVLLLGDISSADPAERAERAAFQARSFVEQGVDGVIFQPIEFMADAEAINERILSVFRSAGIPVILLDYDCLPPPRRSSYDVVGINDLSAGRTLGRHLLARGARRVSFLTQHNRAACIRNRCSGVELACAEVGAAFRRLYGQADDVAVVKRHLRTFRPDAFVCYNDSEAVMLLRTLESLGRRVPTDVMLAGCDDVFHASFASVPLTTIHKPVAAIAQGLLHRLYSRIENPALPPMEICFDAPLVVRASTTK